MVNYTTTSLNTVFFLEANSTNTAIHIFAYYPQQTIGAASASDGSAVTLGGAVTDWIQVKLSSGYYLIVLKENPMLALTRSSSGLTVTQISSDLSATQKWDILCTQPSTGFDTGTFPSGIYYINNTYTRTFLVYNGALSCSSATVAAYGNKMAWNITHVGNSYYTIESMENRGMFLHMTETTVSLEQITDENAPDAALFYLDGTANDLIITGKQSGKNLCSSSSNVNASSSTYSGSCWRVQLAKNYRELSSFTLSDSSLWLEPYGVESISAMPSSAMASFIDEADFKFTSSDESVAKISTTSHGEIRGTGQGGITTVTVKHLPTGRTKTVNVKMGILPEGFYFIRNRESELFLRYGINVQEDYVSIGEMSGGGYPGIGYTGYYYEWQLTLLADGYYKISCRKLSNVLGLRNGEETISGGIYCQTDSGSTGQKWKIVRPTATATEGYKIISATTYSTSNELVLTENSVSAATQGTYSNNSERSDEWDFVQITTELPIELEAQEYDTSCWAAAARMFASNYGQIDNQMSQSFFNFFSGFGDGGTVINITKAINLCLNIDETYSDIIGLQYQVFTESDLQRIINHGDPIIVGIL